MTSAVTHSPQAFAAATEADRRNLQQELLKRLGPAWTQATAPMHARELGVRHEPTRTEFVLVPGGQMRMGLANEDLEELSHHVEMHDGISYSLGFDGKSALPPHPEWIMRDGGRCALTSGAKPVATRAGEFTFQASSFGVQTLLVAHWAADDWHPNDEGAPASSAPWLNGDPAGVCRSTFPIDAMVSEDDIVTLLAALRTRGASSMPAVARACCDLPFD